MHKRFSVWVGIFVTVAIVLFGGGLFLIGNKHKAFNRSTTFYVEFANVSGIGKGAKVRVDGMDSGQVQNIQIPNSPEHKFRLKMAVDDRLRGLIRKDSLVTVETEGVVGDKFLLIHEGTEQAPEEQPGGTLSSKEPLEFGKLMEQAGGLMKQATGTINDVQGRLDGALTAVTTTINNANGIVTDIHSGKGAAGLLLENQKVAADVKQTLENTRQATANLNTASVQVNNVLNQVQSRQLVAKVDDTLMSAKHAAGQLDQASAQVNSTLNTAFAEDQYGETAGANLRQSLANVNQATGNLADDTAALKQEFFFKGFFKKRGYDTLDDLPVEQYRDGSLFKSLNQSRQWIAANDLFTPGPDQNSNQGNEEVLSPAGRAQIDAAVSRIPNLYSSPLIIEGYAPEGAPGQALLDSRRRATMVRAYIELHFHLQPKNIGVIGLNAMPPKDAGQTSWNGVCLVHLAERKK